MKMSPKYVSQFTSSTTHRGVEVKEVELANACLDLDVSRETQCVRDSGSGCGGGEPGDASSAHSCSAADTGSYLQVVVEKHRHRERPRLPAASSPVTHICTVCGGGGAGEPSAGPCGARPVVLRCPLSPSPRLCCACSATLEAPLAADGDNKQPRLLEGKMESKTEQHMAESKTSWKMFGDGNSGHSFDQEPEVVEVYHFEQGAAEWLSAGGRREARLERAARGAGRAAEALAAELLAGPLLLARLPLALLLLLLRAALATARAAFGGAVQAVSDELLKPALALSHNALARPVLVWAGHVGRALRAALAPLAAAAGDALAPAARLLGAARLVELHLHLPPAAHAADRRHATTI